MIGLRGSSDVAMTHLAWANARQAAWSCVTALGLENVPLSASDGRVLARDLTAQVPLPGFPTAAMDGWAVRAPGPWQVIGTVSAGDAPRASLLEGQALRIATGAPIPEGTERIIPWEESELSGAEVRDRSMAQARARTHIRPAGEECAAGDLLAAAGTRVNPALVGLLAAAGHDVLPVRVSPRLRLLVMGDEVVTSGIPEAGKVRDALGVQVPMWVERLGGVVVGTQRVGDDLDQLTRALRESTRDVDAVITTGGTSRGHRDHLREAITEASGSMVCDGVDVRPGHPMMLGLVQGIPVIGLPGNPLSALVAMVTLAAPVLDRLLGRGIPALGSIRLSSDLRSNGPATRLVLGTDDSGDFVGIDHASSAMLRGIAHADGWAIIPAHGASAGEGVAWLPLPWRPRQ